MNCLLEVCLLAATLAIRMNPWVAAPSWAEACGHRWFEAASEKERKGTIGGGVPQELESGISVQLPATRNAVSMPEADQEDALIVTVTEDGSVYVGVNPVDPAALAEEAKTSLLNRTDKKLYIKADARTRYGNLQKVLDAVAVAGVRTIILLTSQRDWSEPDRPMAPKGLEVLLVSPLSAGAEPTVLELLDAGQRWPMLGIHHQNIPWPALESRLSRLRENRAEKAVLVRADARLPLSPRASSAIEHARRRPGQRGSSSSRCGHCPRRRSKRGMPFPGS